MNLVVKTKKRGAQAAPKTVGDTALPPATEVLFTNVCASSGIIAF